LSGLKPIVKTFSTKKDAQKFSREVEGNTKLQLALGQMTTGQDTLGQWVEKFLEQYDKKDQSINGRLKWWKKEYGNLYLAQVTPAIVRGGREKLLKAGNKGKPLKPQTTNRFKANLSTLFEYAIDVGTDVANPCKEVSARPEGKPRERVFTEKERKDFLEAAKHATWDKFYLFVLMGFSAGVRKGELERLQWSDIVPGWP
jgi:integrase